MGDFVCFVGWGRWVRNMTVLEVTQSASQGKNVFQKVVVIVNLGSVGGHGQEVSPGLYKTPIVPQNHLCFC